MTNNDYPKLATAVPGPKSLELHARKQAAVSGGVGTVLSAYIASASNGLLEDIDGNVLIDLGSGIGVTGVGNANPEVVSAISRQAAQFTHTAFAVTPYEGYVETCESLNRLSPGAFAKKTALFNSGAEAVENAVKIARYFTKRDAIVVLENGYHGRTNLTMAMTAKSMPFKAGFGPFAPEIYRLPGSYKLRDGLSGQEAARRVISRIEKEIGASSLAAIVFEPIQGEGGFIVPEPGFLNSLSEYCKSVSALFISDEIQAGMCRTGEWFAATHHSVAPDMVITAKGVAGGMPLSAVTGRADVMDSIHAGGLGGTYTGNPVACAAANAALAWMERNNANGLAREVGRVMHECFAALEAKHDSILEVRGIGAMMALEFGNRESLEPDPDLAQRIAKHCHAKGLVVLVSGTYGNVIRFLPPMSIPLDLLARGLEIFSEAVAQECS